MNSAERLLEINHIHSRLFVEQKPQRDKHRRDYPTGILVTGCMDDRVNFSAITETPLGLVKLQRSIGGRFDLKWPRFQENIQGWNCFEKGKGRNRLVIVTDHVSKSHGDLGCKGFNYDENLAMAASQKLRQQFDHVYQHEAGFYALNCTVETDEEALIFRGKEGATLDLSQMVNASSEKLFDGLRRVYPDMPAHMLIDLLPFAVKNLPHIKRIRALHRSRADKDHKAWVIGVGTGLDWILDGAYIINPFNPDFLSSVETALHLIESGHRKNGRMPVLLASAAFQPSCKKEDNEEGFPEQWRSNWRLAELKARYLAEQLSDVARATVPGLTPQIEYLTTLVNLDTRRATVLE